MVVSINHPFIGIITFALVLKNFNISIEIFVDFFGCLPFVGFSSTIVTTLKEHSSHAMNKCLQHNTILFMETMLQHVIMSGICFPYGILPQIFFIYSSCPTSPLQFEAIFNSIAFNTNCTQLPIKVV